MLLYHGSENIIYKPVFGAGNAANDYGRGFYCTENYDIAGEWACKRESDGFINRYEIDPDGLHTCDLNDPQYSILHWLAVLTGYRGYWQKNSIAEEAKEFLQAHYLIDLSPYDLVRGYRADDSYFSFAQDFIMGTISLRKLSHAMRLGRPGEQIVLKSRQAFDRIVFLSAEPADCALYYPRKTSRDLEARRAYSETRSVADRADDVYILDILRGQVRDDELRV